MKFFLRIVIVTACLIALVAISIAAGSHSISRVTMTPAACVTPGFRTAWQATSVTPKTRAQLQQYVTSAVTIRNGTLVITAHRYSGGAWTSGRTSTMDTCSYTYGTISARILTPKGAGLWPAFWMESPQSDKYEIDITEQIGRRHNLTYGHAFAPGIEIAVNADDPAGIEGYWHTYGIIWTPSGISWTLDGHVYATKNFHISSPLYLVLNLAVGGLWGGKPNDTTPATARMRVAWVHVTPYQAVPPKRRLVASRLPLELRWGATA